MKPNHYVVALLLLGCGGGGGAEANESGGADNIGSGGQHVSGGGSTDVVGVDPSGSGGFTPTAETPAACTPDACQAYSAGKWTIESRCDMSGRVKFASCEGASFDWLVDDVGGSVELSAYGDISWHEETTRTWSVDFPTSCGGCDQVATTFGTEWSFLECSSDDVSCRCSGTRKDTIDWVGTSYPRQMGISIAPDRVPGQDVEWYDVGICGLDDGLVADNPFTGRVVLKRD